MALNNGVDETGNRELMPLIPLRSALPGLCEPGLSALDVRCRLPTRTAPLRMDIAKKHVTMPTQLDTARCMWRDAGNADT